MTDVAPGDGSYGDVDAEALREAQEELQRLEAAERFAPPEDAPIVPAYAPPIGTSPSRRTYAVPGVGHVPRVPPGSGAASAASFDRLGDVAPPAQQLSAQPKTLEDLYAMYPVGDGDYKLRIERKAPTHFHGTSGAVRVAGFLCDYDRPLTLAEFATLFGGQRYEVSVLGPPSVAQRVDAAGNRVIRTLKSIEVSIPGPPKFNFLPSEKNEESMTQQSQSFSGIHPEVEKARIEAGVARETREADERRRLAEEAARAAQAASSVPEKFLGAVREQSDRAVAEVKSLAQQQIDLLSAANNQIRHDFHRVQEENDKLRQQIMVATTDADRRARESETEKISALKAEHERELRRVQEERAQQVDKLSAQYRDDLARLTNSHVEEMRRAEAVAAKERESLVRDAERRENQLTKEADRERSSMRETYESRLSQLKETYESRFRDIQSTTDREIATLKDSKEREIAAVKESRDREIQSIKAQMEMQSSVARDTAALRVESANSEMSRLREEVQRQIARADAAEREAQDLRASSHKDPLQAIEEAKSIVGIVGWGPKEEGASGEEQFDWKKTLAKAGLGIVEKLPEISRDIMATRAQAQQAPVQQAQQVQQLPPFGFQQPRMLPPPGFQQQMPRQGPPPQMQMQRQPPPQYVPPQPPPGSFAPPWEQQRPMQQQFVPPQQPSAPPGPPSPFQYQPAQPPAPPGQPMFQYQPAQPTEQMQAPPQPPPPALPGQEPFAGAPPAAQQPPQSEQAALNLNPEHVAEFLQELEGAIRQGVVPPGLFARGFIERVGAQNARSVVSSLSPESLVQVVQAQENGESTAIATRDGQRYVRELWSAVAQQTGG